MNNSKFLYEDETYKIRKAIFDVYNNVGCGFLENVYQECLEKEFQFQSIPFKAQQKLSIKYRGETLQHKYIPDFICFDKIIIEIKALKQFDNRHQAQVINYLKASDIQIGLLVNFGAYPKVEIIRLVNI